MHAQTRTQRPFLFDLLIILGLFAAIMLRAKAPAGATEVSTQRPDSQLTSGDLGVATLAVSPDAGVHTPDGHGAGPEGVAACIDSPRAAVPEAVFTTPGVQSVNNPLIVDWQGTIDGQLIIPGRTLVTIEDGSIADIWFVNRSSVAPVGGEPFPQTAHDASQPVSGYHEPPYERGRPVVVEAETANQTSATGPAPASVATDADQDARQTDPRS